MAGRMAESVDEVFRLAEQVCTQRSLLQRFLEF
jgi:hypothetical protein